MRLGQHPRYGDAAWSLILAFCLAGFPALGASLQLPPGSVLKNFSLPIYRGRQGSPSVVVRADQVRSEYQRRLFFRVALLPRLVAEGVTVEFLEPPTPELLREVSRQLSGGRASQALVLHRVRLIVTGKPALNLIADSIQAAPSGSWELSGHVQFLESGRTRNLPHASLVIEGKNTLCLNWSDAAGAHSSPWLASP